MVNLTQITAANTHLLANPAPDVFDEAIDPARLAAFVAAYGHFMAVAMDGDVAIAQIRAMVQHQPDAPPVLYIDNLGVAERYQRMGLARSLVEYALAWGAGMGCDQAWVATELDNHPALALYRAFESEPMEAVAFCQLRLAPPA
jgi:ribosomal protein S18 acetylase RimI-like enzyme